MTASYVSLGLRVVGKRSWTRNYRVDVIWNGRRLLRRWLQVRLVKYHPASRVYADEDPGLFDDLCGERTGEDDGPYPDPPVRFDDKGEYCINPPHRETSWRVFRKRPNSNAWMSGSFQGT